MNIFWGFQDFLIYLEKYFRSLLNSPNLFFNNFSQEQWKQNSLNSVNKKR